MTPADLPERMARKITVDPDNGCWIWTGAIGHATHRRGTR